MTTHAARDIWAVEQARTALESLGFLVSDVRQPQRKHADLRALCDRNDYLVAAGPRLPNERWLERYDVLDGSGARAIDRELRPVFAERIRTAERYLRATPVLPETIRLGWFVAEGHDEHALACVEACLLGTRNVQLPGASYECYGFSHPEFALCTELHAAVLEDQSGLRLVVNPFSRALERVRSCSLYAELALLGAVVDPDVEVATGHALMIGMDFVGQRDGRSQLAYLQRKYTQLGATC